MSTAISPMSSPPASLTADTIQDLSRSMGDPDWLRALRSEWWARAEATPPPTGQEEEWRRTELTALPRGGALLTDPPAVEITAPALPDGVVVSDLRDAVREHPELVRRALGQAAGPASHAHFWALAQAAWTGGLFCYVPRGAVVDGTVVARTRLTEAGGTYLPVTLIVAEEGSHVSILEAVSSPDGGEGWFGGIVEIVTGRGAQVRYANLQQLGDGTWNLGSQRVVVGQDATVTTLNAEVGSKVTKLGLDAEMSGPGGTSRLLGLLAAGDDQHIDINARQDLAADHTTSDLLYLSALYDRARAAFYGVTVVEAGTKQTASYQECRNLLLSPQAGAEPIPVLEIKANDILRCGHGATAGAIDPTQLFYAQARGLDPEAAERMIVRGFFEQVTGQIGDETIREQVIGAMAGRIGFTPEVEA